MDDHTEPEEDTKIDIKEACIDLNYIKKEPKEEIIELDGNNYAGTSEEVSIKREVEADLLDPLDTDIIMENEFVKLEDIKEESRRFRNFYCSKCNGVYKGYCLKCSTLSRILNNVPADILEIRDTLMGKGVFLLKALPKNITFGPFEDVPPIESTKGYSWKIKDKKLVNIENGSWIKDVACAVNAVIKNSDIFQFDGKLFLETTKELVEGDEILIYYDDEEIQASDNSEEYYFIPQKRDELPKVFACTLCCYGFSSNECLVEHKSKCPHAEHNEHVQDLELIQCNCCKIWLEKREHEDYHKAYCGRKNQRISADHAKSLVKNGMSVGKMNQDGTNMTERTDHEFNNMNEFSKRNPEQYQSGVCSKSYDGEDSLQVHLEYEHEKETPTNSDEKDTKQYQCGVCVKKFPEKKYFWEHIRNVHGNLKKYTCSKCAYQTDNWGILKLHQNMFCGVKPFECKICMTKFDAKKKLANHMAIEHAKKYKCREFECTYQTDCKAYMERHYNKHNGIKPYKCDICMKEFTHKSYLNVHKKTKHEKNENAEVYNCWQCSFQTSKQQYLKRHLQRHFLGLKKYACDRCKKKYTRKDCLNDHIKKRHIEENYRAQNA